MLGISPVAHHTSLLKETPRHPPLSLVETDITSITRQSTTMSIGRTNCTREQQGRRKRQALHLVTCAVFADALDLLDNDEGKKLKELYKQRRKQYLSQICVMLQRRGAEAS